MAAMTHRLPRSSRTPGLRFPPAKTAAPDSAKSAIERAISAGLEKKAEKPPLANTAKPSWETVPTTMSVNRAVGITIRTRFLAHLESLHQPHILQKPVEFLVVCTIAHPAIIVPSGIDLARQRVRPPDIAFRDGFLRHRVRSQPVLRVRVRTRRHGWARSVRSCLRGGSLRESHHSYYLEQ